jgi:hypothetical protein
MMKYSKIKLQRATSNEGLKVNSSLLELNLVRLVIFICDCIVVLLLRERAGGECAAESRDVYAHACV